MAAVLIPAILRPHTGGQERLEVPAGTVDDALAAVTARFPEAGARLRQALTRRYVIASINGRDIRDLAEGQTPMGDGDELHLLWAVAGG
jgi:molybdopterin synthase sulfur carrier subunit